MSLQLNGQRKECQSSQGFMLAFRWRSMHLPVLKISWGNDRIVCFAGGNAVALVDGKADFQKDPLLGVFLPRMRNPLTSWWTVDSDPKNDEERHILLSGEKRGLVFPNKEADYRFLLFDGLYRLLDEKLIRFTVAILYVRGEKKFLNETENVRKIHNAHFTSGLQKSLAHTRKCG